MMCTWGISRHVRLCQPKPVSGSLDVPVDACIAPLVQMLNDFGVRTTGSCCGHEKHGGWITFEQDGKQSEIRIMADCEFVKPHSSKRR